MKVKIEIREGETITFATFKMLAKKASKDLFDNETLVFEKKEDAKQVLNAAAKMLRDVRIGVRLSKNGDILQNVKTGAQLEIVKI